MCGFVGVTLDFAHMFEKNCLAAQLGNSFKLLHMLVYCHFLRIGAG